MTSMMIETRSGMMRVTQPDRFGPLMQAAQAGDGAAYNALLRGVLPLLRARLRQRLYQPADAEDAVQDTLLAVHALRHTYDPGRPFLPWLFAIAERKAIDRMRSSGRRRARETSLDDVPADSMTLAAAPRAEAEVAARQVRDLIARLPPAQRAALSLAKLRELPLTEAARESGMSVGALKVASHRAVRALRRMVSSLATAPGPVPESPHRDARAACCPASDSRCAWNSRTRSRRSGA
jgi:RNA polymerase sigma-70 factor (ECF subfamily)